MPIIGNFNSESMATPRLPSAMAAMVSFAFLVVVNGGCVGNSCPEMSVDLLQRKLDMNEAANKQLKGSRPNLLSPGTELCFLFDLGQLPASVF